MKFENLTIKEMKRNLSSRLGKLSGRTLSTLSRITGQINYQRGITVNALKGYLRDTKNKAGLRALNEIVTEWEQFRGNQTLSQIVDGYYTAGSEEIKRFIRIQRSKGWGDDDILKVLESAYNTIMYMESEDMMRVEDAEDFWDWYKETAE